MQYAKDVVAGKIIVNQYILLACQRYLNWFSRTDIFFDIDKFNKIVDFIYRLRHFEGPHAKKPFKLLNWQVWCIANIFSWYYTDDPTKRVIRDVFLLISRKNGKTTLAAAIMLADMIIGGEPGYEGYLIANSREQAKIAYKYISTFARQLDPRSKFIKVYRDYIKYSKTNGIIKVLPAEPTKLDGLNPSSFLWDEVAAAKSYDCYSILKSGQGMRKNPLSISITSAGFLLAGYPGYEQCQYSQRVLRGEIDEDSYFAGIYQLDDNDDYKDESVWQKACPSYPTTVSRDYMEMRVREAMHQPSKEVDVKTKNFNIWCMSANGWMSPEYLKKVYHKVDISQLLDETVYVGVDLSSTRDLTCQALMFPPNPYRDYYPDKYIFTCQTWIPKYALKYSPNKHLYEWYIDSGQAETTPTESIDYQVIVNKTIEIENNYSIATISYDSWKSNMYVKLIEDQGLPLTAYPQGLSSFTRPT